MSLNSFNSRGILEVGDASYNIYRLGAVPGLERLPYSLKVLAENLLRTEDGANVTAAQIEALASWEPTAEPNEEIQFIRPCRYAGLHRSSLHRRSGNHA